MSVLRGRINPEKASLIGGIVVGIASMVLWVAVTRELGIGGAACLGVGLLVSIAVATWIRLADL
jgi:hypothetical protein